MDAQHEPKQAREFLKLDFRRRDKSAHGELRALAFKTDEFIVIYLPSLNLSAYGKTDAEAGEMLQVVANDFFENLFELPEAEMMNELRRFGWQRKPFLPKQLRNIKFIDEGVIRQELGIPNETPIQERLVKV